ncbi:MAG TPA: hypothetical protein VGM20_09320 [Gemmatimonadales bacterium]|jgi:hypothetical protein
MSPPSCRRLGRHCRTLDVTLRVAAIEGEEDHDATWLLGHTERIDFGPLFERDGELWCDASIHVPCRFLATGDDAVSVRCTAHGFDGRLKMPERTPELRALGDDRFAIVERQRLVTRQIEAAPPAAPARRALPVVAEQSNPCATARCRTADNRQGAACCRDVQVDIACSPRATHLEALIRSRKSPLLCKTDREEDDRLVVEIISACGYLDTSGACRLHGRTRADGRPAKPIMCSKWPEKRSGLHPGCAFRNTRLKV